jgi:hypothetical protein
MKDHAERWPKKIASIDANFTELKAKLKEQNLGYKVMFGLCERSEPPVSDSEMELMCFQQVNPQVDSMTYITLNSSSQASELWTYLKTGEIGSLTVKKLPEDFYILVCSHRSRDERCGHCGPIIAEEFQKKLLSSYYLKAAVYKISHVGKHQYAANVITYPSGDWYGYVKPADIPRILAILPGPAKPYTQLSDLWRGAMNLKIEEQMALSPNAVLGPSKSQRVKILNRRTDWRTYGFGPVGNEMFNDFLWIISLSLLLMALFTTPFFWVGLIVLIIANFKK